MVGVILTAILAAIIGCGIVRVITNIIPKANAVIKTIISVIIVAVISFLVALISAYNTLQIVVTTICAIGISQLFYNYLLKLLDVFIEKVKSGIKKLK